LLFAFGAAMAVLIIGLALMGTPSALALFGVALSVWLMVGAISEIAFRIKLGRASLAESWRRGAGLPRSAWGTAVAHFGVGVTVLGVIGATAWNSEEIATLKPGDAMSIGSYSGAMDGFVPLSASNYTGTAVRFTVRKGGAVVATMEPEKRLYTVPNTPTTEAAIKTFGFSQLYVSLGDISADGATVVRVYWKTLVTLIWIGALIMTAGGALSLSDRRLRVGAPKPARRSVAVPAE